MSEFERDPAIDDEPGWEPAPPGFMDRPEVKAAVERVLSKMGDRRIKPGLTGNQALRKLREQGYLEPRPD